MHAGPGKNNERKLQNQLFRIKDFFGVMISIVLSYTNHTASWLLWYDVLRTVPKKWKRGTTKTAVNTRTSYDPIAQQPLKFTCR